MLKNIVIVFSLLAGLSANATVGQCDFPSMDGKIIASLTADVQAAMSNLGIAADWTSLRLIRQDTVNPAFASYVLTFISAKGSFISAENDFTDSPIGAGVSDGKTVFVDTGIALNATEVVTRDSEGIPVSHTCVVQTNFGSQIGFVNNSQNRIYLTSPTSQKMYGVFTWPVTQVTDSMPLN